MKRSIAELCWDVDPRATVGEIAEWCRIHRGVDRLLLVARQDAGIHERLSEPGVEYAVGEIFGRYVLKTTCAKAWAGTKLFRGRTAKIWTIEFNDDVQKRMISVENVLGGWVHSRPEPLPEDICLYRFGETLPTFVSVTHEPEGWLLDARADGADFAERSIRTLPRSLIPPPPYFFR